MTIKESSKSGCNKQIVLAALSELLGEFDFEQRRMKFISMRAGISDQGGPKDVAGTILTSNDMQYTCCSRIKQWLTDI